MKTLSCGLALALLGSSFTALADGEAPQRYGRDSVYAVNTQKTPTVSGSSAMQSHQPQGRDSVYALGKQPVTTRVRSANVDLLKRFGRT